MSDWDELARLKADLEVLERYAEDTDLMFIATGDVKSKIARLEAAADPWRDAKRCIEQWRNWLSDDIKAAISYIDHLTAENARLAARVAELEADAKAEDDADIADAASGLPYMHPPFEGPIVGIDPVLEPVRVLATAAELGWGPTVYAEMTLLRDAKPYQLKKGGSDAK